MSHVTPVLTSSALTVYILSPLAVVAKYEEIKQVNEFKILIKGMWFVFISAAYANFHLIFISNDQDLDFSWLFLLFSGIHCHILFRNKFMYKSLPMFIFFFFLFQCTDYKTTPATYATTLAMNRSEHLQNTWDISNTTLHLLETRVTTY